MQSAQVARDVSIGDYSKTSWSKPLERQQPYPPLRAIPAPEIKSRRLPLLVKANHFLWVLLSVASVVVLCGYGLDVTVTGEVGKLQEHARRLKEENTELSAQLLRTISFQGIQDNAPGRFGLSVPEQVLIVKEAPSPQVQVFKPQTHCLPMLAGY